MSNKPRLVVATRNTHKTSEIRALLGDRYEVLDSNDFPETPKKHALPPFCCVEAERWKEVPKIYMRMMGLALQRKSGQVGVNRELVEVIVGKEGAEEGRLKSAHPFGGMLRHRVRYFTDGAVIGSRAFVNEAFTAARERFPPKRKDGAADAG